MFQSASKHATFIQKIEKLFGKGAQPLARLHPQRYGEPPPAPTHLIAYGASILAPSTLNPCPLSEILNTPLLTDAVNVLSVCTTGKHSQLVKITIC